LSELKQNRLDTAKAKTALNTAFELTFCIISPPRESGAPYRS